MLQLVNKKADWVNTDAIFEVSEKEGATTINIIHNGLVPDIEFYCECIKDWVHYIKEILLKLMTTGKGLPW